jgi:hypothetical protein
MSVVFPKLSVVSIVISFHFLEFCVVCVQLLLENAQNIEVWIENKIWRK